MILWRFNLLDVFERVGVKNWSLLEAYSFRTIVTWKQKNAVRIEGEFKMKNRIGVSYLI